MKAQGAAECQSRDVARPRPCGQGTYMFHVALLTQSLVTVIWKVGTLKYLLNFTMFLRERKNNLSFFKEDLSCFASGTFDQPYQFDLDQSY